MKRLITLFAAVLLLSSSDSFAHGYWMETEGSHKVNEPVTIKLIFGEFITGERLSGAYLDRMKEIKVFVLVDGKQQPITMKQLPGHWEGIFVPKTEGSYAIVGINEEREVQDWTKHNLGMARPVQYLKTIYQVGPTVTKHPLFSLLDITVSADAGNRYTIQVFKNNASFSEAKVTATDTSGNEQIITLDKEGKASFDLGSKGLHLIDVDWIDKTPGTFKEKKYESIRYKLDFSLYKS